MPSYLIVANQTLSSPTLMAAVQERVEADEAHFHVVVPATPIPHALTWDEREAEAAAQERLTAVLDRLRRWAPMPRARWAVPTLLPLPRTPSGSWRWTRSSCPRSRRASSRWLGQDVPARLRGRCPSR